MLRPLPFTSFTKQQVRVYDEALSATDVAELRGNFTQLLARYSFDGETTDSSGNDYDCTVSGTVTYAEDRMGNSNGALSMAGTLSCGSIGDTDCPGLSCGSALNDKIANANSRTVCAWVYVDGFTNGAIFQAGDDSSDGALFAFIGLESSSKWYAKNWGTCDVDMTASYGSSTSTWQHWCSVYDGVTLTQYFDAAEVHSNDVSLITTSGSEFYIGFFTYEGGHSFNGRIDEVRAENRPRNRTFPQREAAQPAGSSLYLRKQRK